MHFADLYFLNLIWIIFIVAGLFVFFDRAYQRTLEAFGQTDLLRQLMHPSLILLRRVSMGIILIVLSFSMFALMRPLWGYTWEKSKRVGLDIVLVVDVSKSMLSTDVKPNRLERTKLAIRDLLENLKGDRVGLVAFAGSAVSICPLTVDYNGFIMAMNNLNYDVISRGGTNIERGLSEALKGYNQSPGKYKAVILITDGENWEGDPLKVADLASSQGVKIFCIGVGTKDGDLIPIKNSEGGQEFLKDDKENFVKTRLSENILESIASATQGTYIKASGVEFGLNLIYNQYLSGWDKKEFEAKVEKRYFERFQIPLLIAILFLILDTVLWIRPGMFIKSGKGGKGKNDL
ncbi:MAG: VWA domain-containing protein [Candidatus Omnitrophica bacterium]|nr:VWA domain-containing protein [Candidatus Omnitrophota bacterium]